MAESLAPESIFAATVFLFLGAASTKLLAFTRVPYSVLLLVGAVLVDRRPMLS